MKRTELSDRFDDALAFARQKHKGQYRKESPIPYIAHLLSTAALVLEAGGDEDMAIAGLLHDVLEDSDYTNVSYQELVDRFGTRVADIVRDCSDAEPAPGVEKEPWKPRKERYLDRLRTHGPDSLLVSNADKLHNARSVLTDYRSLGEDLWRRFNPESDLLWYYGALTRLFLERRTPLAEELDRVLTELERLVGLSRAAGTTGSV